MDFKKLSKAYIKIAYEIAYYILGEKYLKDPIGIKLSESLLKENEQGSLKYDKGFNINEPVLEKYNEHVIHYIFITRYEDNKIYAFISLFNIYNQCILITENATSYENFKDPYLMLAFFHDKNNNKTWYEKYNDLNFVEFISDYINRTNAFMKYD